MVLGAQRTQGHVVLVCRTRWGQQRWVVEEWPSWCYHGVLLKCGDDSFSHRELWRNVYHLPTQEIPGLKGYRLPSSNMSGLDERSFEVSI